MPVPEIAKPSQIYKNRLLFVPIQLTLDIFLHLFTWSKAKGKSVLFLRNQLQ